MRIFKYRLFHQWAKKERISDNTLIKSVEEIGKGIFDANLGGCLYKKRVPRKGQGKRSSYRTILGRVPVPFVKAKNEETEIKFLEIRGR